MKKYTAMKNRNGKYRNPVIGLLIIAMLIAGCFEIDFVNQPYTANPNSYFSVEISVIIYRGEEGVSGIPYFGVLMPVGWTADDSIQYVKEIDADTGYVYFSDSLSQLMNTIDPPPENYYWWVATDENSVSDGTYLVNFNIYTDNQTGDFFLDYMVGSKEQGLNYNRSNDHLIIIGEVEGCAPEEVVFSSQEDIDNFQSNYPGCNVMAGDVTISGNNITNFNGLCVLTKIGGSLHIIDNTALTYLTGLENLDTIGCNLIISGNTSLINIQDLDNLKSIERGLIIKDNSDLVQINGLNSLTTIGRSFSIEENNNLAGIEGLKDLTSVGRDFSIKNNGAIVNLTGLEALNSINGNLEITENNALASLTGLENLSFIGENLTITLNPLLSNCEAEGICTYLYSPTGYFAIRDNAPGCSSIIEVAVACGTALPCQEEQSYFLYSQFDVDNFPAVFPGCTEIATSIYIYGDDIVNLDSLEVINSISGNLTIGDYNNGNSNLTSLTGLNNLTSIGGDLYLSSNYKLTSLAGLENLSAIGGYLRIEGNNALTTLNSLENLSSIGGSILIWNNDSLASLTGLESITFSGGNLSISGNDALASLSGLDNLTAIDGSLDIENNKELTSMTGLKNITSIGGNISISGNNALFSLAGLDNITSIAGDLFIDDNTALTSLTGLENVTSIGERLMIGYIFGNDNLTSLTGLNNLNSIGGNLSILYNNSLTSLTGLEIVTSIGGELWIYSNPLLSNCEAEGICIYLSSPNGYINIHDNASGCNSKQEVQEACWIVHIEDGQTTENQFTFYPNPVTANAKLIGEFVSAKTINICLYNTTGICIKSWEFGNQQSGTQEFSLNLSELPPGIYFLRLQAGNEVAVKKLVKL